LGKVPGRLELPFEGGNFPQDTTPMFGATQLYVVFG